MAHALTTSQLADILQSLPQELYNQIYNTTFTAKPDEVVDLDDMNPFPHLLHVDRKSRELFATSYYAGSCFAFRQAHRYQTYYNTFKIWSYCVPGEHFSLSTTIIGKVQLPEPDTSNEQQRVRKQQRVAMTNMSDFAIRFGLFSAPFSSEFDVVRVQVWAVEKEGITTERLGTARARKDTWAMPNGWQNLRATIGGVSV